MKSHLKIGKGIQGAFFLVIIVVVCINTHLFSMMSLFFKYSILNYFYNQVEYSDSIATISSEFNENIFGYSQWINLTGLIEKKFGMNALYNNENIYVDEERYIVSKSDETSTDYEYEQVLKLKNFLDDEGINLLYVNAPTKYLDDSFFSETYGVETFSNQNADRFMKRISDAGVNTVDLRQNTTEDIHEMFYRTDHHWTTRSCLWAASEIAENLKQKFNYPIQTELYDPSNYSVMTMENSWLGEQGNKLSETYIGLDDYSIIKPKFDTDISYFVDDETEFDGSFDVLVSDEYYSEEDIYNAPSYHYSYMGAGYNNACIINNNVEDGNILVIGDSYGVPVVPFLSLGVSKINFLVLRNCDVDLKEYIRSGNFDTVIILYAEFMIGAHDDVNSANYKMFEFE